MVIRLLQPALRYFQIYGRWLRSTVGKWKVPQNLACSSLLQISWKNWLSRRLTIDLLQTIGSIWRLSFRFSVHNDANYRRWLWFFVMIAWMYCVGEGWRSCEDATMSKSLPVASLFCWFCKYEVHELVYFLTFRKNGIMFCFVLFCSFGNRSESFFIWMIHLFVFGTETLICQISALGWLVGGGMGGVNCEANHELHMFSLYFR